MHAIANIVDNTTDEITSSHIAQHDEMQIARNDTPYPHLITFKAQAPFDDGEHTRHV